MSERLKNFLIVGLALLMALVLAVLVATNEPPQDRVERIGSLIKCPVCQGESIAASPSQMAVDMMALVEERVESGASDQEIIDELLNSFSGAVLLDPPASGVTLLLWLAPLAAVVIGVVVLAWWKRHPGEDPTEQPQSDDRRTRKLTTVWIVVSGFVAAALIVGGLIQDPPSAAEGAAASEIDLANASNETMEAVVAANLDHPQIAGMRLALAERYFEEGDYRSAFPHYLAVAESPSANDSQAVTALIRLGWMAYDGNGEVGASLTLFDEALAIAPGSAAALYLKGQVLWCGANDPAAGAELFREVLADTGLDGDTRAQVDASLAAAESGEDCR